MSYASLQKFQEKRNQTSFLGPLPGIAFMLCNHSRYVIKQISMKIKEKIEEYTSKKL